MKRKNNEEKIIYYKGFKTKCYPKTEEQIQMIFKSIGVSRYVYNWGLSYQKQNYAKGNKHISYYDLRKIFNKFKNENKEVCWLKEVAERTCRLALEDLQDAFQKFFDKESKFPQFKCKKALQKSFGLNFETLKFNENQVKLEKIGWIDLAETVPNGKYVNPKLSFDGIDFWFSVSIASESENYFEECKPSEPGKPSKPKTEPIGIDLGVKTLFVCSNGMKNKKPNIKKYQKKLKRLQRKASRNYEKLNKLYKKLIKDNPQLRYDDLKSNKLRKLEKEINKLHKRIKGLLDDNIHQTTTRLVKLNPSAIVIEDLNITGMMKNKHLSRSIQEAKFYEIRRQLKYKCKNNNIKLVIADRWYPSSKICSCCGHKKDKLSLNERTYICEECGLIIDRDYNASINLKNLAI